MRYSQNLLYSITAAKRIPYIILFLYNKYVCIGSSFFLRDSPGVDYRFSPPRVTILYYYCYTDMRIKAYKGSGYTIQLIVKAAHTVQYRFVV